MNRRLAAGALVWVIFTASGISATMANPAPARPQPSTAGQNIAETKSSGNDSDGLKLELEQLKPAAPVTQSTLKVSGTITNNTTKEVSGLTIELRVSTERITDRDLVANVSTGSNEPETRGVIDGTESISAPLAVGATQQWSMRLPMSDLQLGNSGVYFVRFNASADQDSGVFGSTRTFIPWFPNPESIKPTKVVWLWPMSDWPNRDAQGILLNDRTPRSLVPGGRLARLLDAGLLAKKQASWVVDPELLQAAAAMSNGYQVLAPGATPVAGTAVPEISQWLARARTGLKSADVSALAYANSDVTALKRARLDEDVVLATTPAPDMVNQLLQRTGVTGLGWPPGGRTDRATLDLLKTAGANTIVLDDTSVRSDEGDDPMRIPLTSTRTQAGPVSLALADGRLSDTLGLPQATAAEALMARQLFLAQTGVITTNSSEQPRTVVVAPDVRWDPAGSVINDLLAVLRTSTWARSASLTNLLKKPPATTGQNLAGPGASQRRDELPADYLSVVKKQQRQLDLLSSVLVEPGTLTSQFRSALLRTESGAWRIDRPEGQQLLNRVSEELESEINQVRVISSGTVTFSSGEGKVPITIANDLDSPVRVGLRLTSDPSIRLVSKPLEPMTIPANRKVSTEVSAQVLGAGELPVKVQLTTPAGGSYGHAAEVTLRSTAYAKAATWVVAIAFIVLTALLVMNSIRRRRQRRDRKNETARV